MKDDGSMARLDDLAAFAQRHSIKLGTIADLISYRLRKECCVEWLGDDEIESRYGGAFTLKTYRNTLNGQEHSVLVKGDLLASQPILVRVHAMNMRSDLLGVGDDVLHQSMKAVAAHGSGVIVLLRGDGMQERPAAQSQDGDSPMLRHYGIGAQILRHLGVVDMVLLTKSPKNIVGLQGYGLNIIDQKWIEA
jgi:3,4-dihydroxy 2-butanone 4-phosphate synthase/GTP cyclohydrolase II